ncbi:hypothetical protein SELMODRAFT_423696 [Selaginella moellendorffii]|uniref:Uncharacterized protein n=1 Tax=Selaginella moellendorffii TaxID=88036 RepID=D8SML0_SELML|nr:uncharacterized protein LOC9644775 isoform X1 [Selaginella moellendorffii]EFJ14290.1 hypothetical protein SELMODRAFT_423696 [Selaginella moellendorffii]|eukprot:XP_002984645.1 uncharacterized protein LOC9644775 isoform X1 [Selaginella moellendorffii]
MAVEERSGVGIGSREIWSKVSRKAKAAFADDRSRGRVGSWFHNRGRDLETREQNLCEVAHASDDRVEIGEIPQEFPARAGFESSAPPLQKKLEAFASSLSQFGGSIGKAIEDGFTRVETKASNLMSMRSPSQKPRKEAAVLPLDPSRDGEFETLDIQHSREVVVEQQEMKALREELEFALRRIEKLEANNEKLEQDNEKLEQENAKLIEKLKQQAEIAMMAEEDDLVRSQMEKLHQEKSRLAKENENFAIEIRCLRGLMEFDQLSLQEVRLNE